MSGMFPDHIAHRQHRRSALNRISDALLFPHHHTPDRLMRQVQDVARWRHAG
jgi:hypothetical protein